MSFGNLLNTALGVLPTQTVKWKRFKGYEIDDRGRETATYYRSRYFQASVQPVDYRDYEQFGLDANKRYFMIWASHELETVARDRSPDKFEYEGFALEAVGNDDWYMHNGWRAVLCVRV